MPDPTDNELIAEWKRLNNKALESIGDDWTIWRRKAACDELDYFLGSHSTRLLALVERLNAERDGYETLAERLADEVAELRYGADDSDWEMPASQGGGE